MKKVKQISFLIVLTIQLGFVTSLNAQTNMKTNKPLTNKEQSIIPIAAFTTKGDTQQLRTALNSGLDAGLNINEIKEIIVQIYAYAGFPRSLNALSTFITVLEERKKMEFTMKLEEPPLLLQPTKTN